MSEYGSVKHKYYLGSSGEGGTGNAPFFCNYFKELETVLFEIELIIINTRSINVYPNTIKTYLTPNHLLFGRQLLHSYNTISIVVRSLTVLSSTADKINHTSNQLSEDIDWRETQRTSKLNINFLKFNVNDIAIVF